MINGTRGEFHPPASIAPAAIFLSAIPDAGSLQQCGIRPMHQQINPVIRACFTQ
jgi:hypothetical protein